MSLWSLRLSGKCADPEVVRENFNKIQEAFSDILYKPEIIPFTGVSTVTVDWTQVRIDRFGVFPQQEVYVFNPEDSKYYLFPTEPGIDAPPPDFTQMTYDFGSNLTGFIIIT